MSKVRFTESTELRDLPILWEEAPVTLINYEHVGYDAGMEEAAAEENLMIRVKAWHKRMRDRAKHGEPRFTGHGANEHGAVETRAWDEDESLLGSLWVVTSGSPSK